jgi:hypothetical protein
MPKKTERWLFSASMPEEFISDKSVLFANPGTF